ncbi:uncharacterized protein BDW47DRAFT_125924 [Aspergillus candidus]|uniref:Uncharacterized protein n=1 Tax=Aspergillus candidus TaxID=41067 RepID=A0A2I2FBD4_ASPCN|nr:hypothetical protein BDW47DRAFT_125924 [Aspergillus candidus]PLB37940.1 hypothetical protein BDW47DRAFT_125924 [Aspergillus candidus]
MKLSNIAPLSTTWMASAVTAREPYNAAYDQYCGNGQTQSSLSINGTPYSYYCDVEQSTGASPSLRVRSPEICADICDGDSSCDTAVWDRSNGQYMVISNDPLAVCQANLVKYMPVAPLCHGADTRRSPRTHKRDPAAAEHWHYS